MNVLTELAASLKECLVELRDTKFALTALLSALGQQESLDRERLSSDFEAAFLVKRRGEEDAKDRAMYFIREIGRLHPRE